MNRTQKRPQAGTTVNDRITRMRSWLTTSEGDKVLAEAMERAERDTRGFYDDLRLDIDTLSIPVTR